MSHTERKMLRFAVIKVWIPSLESHVVSLQPELNEADHVARWFEQTFGYKKREDGSFAIYTFRRLPYPLEFYSAHKFEMAELLLWPNIHRRP
jgi:hypothetical protein